ncbi:U4/U6 x U5 tri-snRNP complex subunit Prp1 [Coniosporium apollinis]|uniref:U4/U6 x U5 tri-snRNP complex subunit Prp1 n=1 Tax=Coniosporium apollinis TaxID=61459 RepID=A0ABQ9NZG9_9PEZI|nr:U4/U6 x U5 tri-snRNP complex subunit Prp1 [Coniosporium apollinis]
MTGRKDFLSQPAPENYVAGLGRGATGFTTRSDLGPAREGPSEEQIKEALAKRAAQLGQAPPTAYGATGKKDDDDDDERFQDPENEVGLFANGTYDRDDDEADRIYQDVDERMDRRRKARRLVSPKSPHPIPLAKVIGFIGLAGQIANMRPFAPYREAREQKEREEYERNNPKIQQQFADLKRALGSVTDEDWANIPEVGDLTGKNRRAKQELRKRFYAVPDSVIAGARDATQFDTSISADGADGASADNADGNMTNFAHLQAAKDKVLQVRLDQAAQAPGMDSVAGTATNIDPKGYLTSLSKSELKAGEVPVGDINRARELLESVARSNPKHGPAWIALARLEEFAGKIVKARQIIAEGCARCPTSEDCWLENIRLNDSHNAKVIAANAIKALPRSTRLWTTAMNLETDIRAKKRVLRQALDHIPQSVQLWREAVNLEEDPADARLLLAKATEVIPLATELWLALARLETPENARAVLNKARKAVGGQGDSHLIWVAASRLEEALGNTAMVYKVMERGVKILARESAMLKREEWIAQAEKCEEEGAVITCGAIIRETLGWGLDEDDDRKDIWMDDAKDSIARGKYETARAIYAYALRLFYNKKSVWRAAIDLERNHGTREALWQLLEKAVEACPHEDFWMDLAKSKWQAGQTDEARRVLKRAFDMSSSENIWLFAVQMEADNGQIDQARQLLTAALDKAGTDRVYVKFVAFERQQGNIDAALDLVTRGLELYPHNAKLHMQKGQIYESLNKLPAAREAYAAGIRACPKSVPLYLLAARLEEKAGVTVKARSILDRARLQVPKNPEILTERVRLERRAGNLQAANNLMAQALQELPTSGLLYSEKIMHLEARTHRKPRALEAIKRVENDPYLFVTIARIFWGERRLEKAMSWFEKAILLDADLGDTWAWYYKFLLQHGTDEKREEVVSKCVLAEPRHGEVWQAVAKDPKNAGKGREEILKMVVQRLE